MRFNSMDPIRSGVMIILESPHMGLNDQRAPAAVQMWNHLESAEHGDARAHHFMGCLRRQKCSGR